MKTRIICLISAVYLIFSCQTTATAATNHTYYSQKNLTYEGKNLGNSMCFCSSVAMVLTDAGIPTTPVDIYVYNGKTPYTKAFSSIAKDFGATYQNFDVRTLSAEKKEEKLKSLLKSGNYPQGFIVYGGGHMIVARKIENDTIYFDDPAVGCCLTIDKCTQTKWRNITYFGCFTKGRSAGNQSTPKEDSPLPSVSDTASGNWIITIPANYKLLLYSNANSASSSGKYVSAKSSSYQIVCTKRATLSNGSVRYYALFNSTNDPYWFVYGNGMTIQNTDTYKTFKITFNPNSGTVSSANKTVSQNSTYGTLPTPIRNGYIFDGWYTTKSGGTKITASTTVNLTSDQTLYAHWTSVKTYTVTFDANGGSIDQTTRNIQAGSPIGALPTPTRSGYKFIGWKDVKEGSGMIVNSETFIVEGDLKLYANWSKIEEDNTVTISFNANGGSVSPSVKTIKVGESYGNLPTPSRDGYVFDGWYTASQDGSRITSSTVATKNQTLYAYWSANTPKKVYTIYFDVNGGMNSSRQSKTVTAGKPYGTFPVPARNGYSFDGWYTSQSGGEKIYESMIVNIDSDQTLYAHWSKEAKTYTVVFDPNGGSVSPQTKTVTAGFAYGELPIPTYDGFIFLGWYTGKTKITSSSTYDLNRDITLYAQWEREQLQDEIESSPESSLKIEGLNVSVSQKGIIPQYTVSSNYPINYLWTSLNDPNGDLIQGGNTSFNPAYKIYETDDSGIVYSFALFQSMDANREYSFTVEARDESGKAVTATATFVMPFSIKNGEIVP